MWTERDLQTMLDPQLFYQGRLIELTGGVYSFETYKSTSEYGDLQLDIVAEIRDKNERSYSVEVTMYYDDNMEEDHFDYYCPCDSFRNKKDLCKHCVATLLHYIRKPKKTLLALEDNDFTPDNPKQTNQFVPLVELPEDKPDTRSTDYGMAQILRQMGEQENWLLTSGSIAGKIHLEAILQTDRRYPCVSLRIGEKKMYVVKDIAALVNRVQTGQWFAYGKQFGFTHQLEAFDAESRPLMEYFMRQFEDSDAWYNFTSSREYFLRHETLDSFIDVVRTTGIYLAPYTKSSRLWYPVEEPYRKALQISSVEDGIELTLEQPPVIHSHDWQYIFSDQKIYRISRRNSTALNTFEKNMAIRWDGNCFISNDDLPVFTRDFLPELESVYQIQKIGYVPEKYLPDEAVFRIYLDLPQQNLITCDLVADYGNDQIYHVFDRNNRQKDSNRNMREEAKIAALISSYCNAFDDRTGNPVATNDENCMFELLTKGLGAFEEVAEIFISDRLKKIRVIQPPKISIGITMKEDLLNFQIESDSIDLDELAYILSKYDRKKKFYRLKSGEFFPVEDTDLDTLAQLQEGLMLTSAEMASGDITLPKFRAPYLDEQLRQGNSLSVQKEKSFRELIRNMKTVEDSDFEIPEKFRKILREYQKTGYLWLETLYQNGFGGILADDMGLGKTLQVIVFLYAHYIERQETHKNTLIVCPASLVYNWEREIHHFAPELTVYTVAGNVEERKSVLTHHQKGSIFITSYDLLRRDTELYQQLTFAYQIIDEAQFIKNATTKAAKAVKQISSDFRIALTGTPVENHLGELWSIFDYLMPGYLYSYKRFHVTFEIPIVQIGNPDALERLQKLIAPFVLRRLKKDVLKDLPEKLEKNMFTPLTGEQEDLYRAHVQRLEVLLSKQSQEEFNQSKIEILAELTKLRQLCCDPALLYENYQAGSAKLDLCLELIQNAISGGHKMLIFSQFTTMLDGIAERLKQENIPYYVLKGSTPKQERMQLVNTFNQDETPVFLISLKAGGTGLNLTAADIVIHYDPWWNTAVQNQATDRAHRIGQKNKVLVYRLIAQNTIEEKILRLQEKKAQLADQILGGETTKNPAFSREELLALLQD